MELQLVSLEQAKVLKELGFNYPTTYWYGDYYDDEDDPEHKMGLKAASIPTYVQNWNDTVKFPIKDNEFDNVYSAPTLELVAKWLREEKDIILLPTPMVKWSESKERYYGPHYESCYTNWNSPILKTLKEKDKYGNFNPMEFATYEEALRAGIDKAIETLKNKDI